MTRVIPKAPRAPSIRYVDQDAPTIPLRGLDEARAKEILDRAALRNKPDTLMPLAADATLERFVASELDESDADITLRMVTRREMRVRAVARWAVLGTVAAALAILAVAALRPRASAASVMAMDHRNPRRDLGSLVVPGVTAVPIFVDDERVGLAPGPIDVACGARRVRIGESGSTRVIDVPCEGRVEL